MESLDRACRNFINNFNDLQSVMFLNPMYLEISILLLEIADSMIKLENSIKEKTVDKKIRKIEKGVKKSEHELKELERMDKKRDPVCEMGKEAMKKKKKK